MKKTFYFLFIIFTAAVLTSCGKDELEELSEEKPVEEPIEEIDLVPRLYETQEDFFYNTSQELCKSYNFLYETPKAMDFTGRCRLYTIKDGQEIYFQTTIGTYFGMKFIGKNIIPFYAETVPSGNYEDNPAGYNVGARYVSYKTETGRGKITITPMQNTNPENPPLT